jgi:ribonuclease P protein component
MKGRVRLRRKSEFQTTLQGRRIFSGRGLVMLAVQGGADRADAPVRVGVTVSKQLKTAVARNRARRRLREVARLTLLAPDSAVLRRGIRYDVVLIARPAALTLRFADLKEETEQAALRLSKLDS